MLLGENSCVRQVGLRLQ